MPVGNPVSRVWSKDSKTPTKISCVNAIGIYVSQNKMLMMVNLWGHIL